MGSHTHFFLHIWFYRLLIDEFYTVFPYNGYYNEIGKKMHFMLKKKLDSSNIIKGYEFYNKDIETMTIKM
nr:MAG TPA: hypothetical protein [Caudoviricetes sp.]